MHNRFLISTQVSQGDDGVLGPNEDQLEGSPEEMGSDDDIPDEVAALTPEEAAAAARIERIIQERAEVHSI